MNDEDEQTSIEPILLDRPREPDFGWFRRTLGRAFLKLVGWRADTVVPDVPKGVIIAAPHTSSWDLTIMLAVSYSIGVRLRWMARHTMFRGPGRLLKLLGGIPVDRTRRRNAVQQMIDRFDAAERLLIVIAPDGKLERAEHWKSGFYHIALGANVPIGLGFLDYGKKAGGVGVVFDPTGDVQQDMDFIRRFYRDISPRHPEKHGPIRLKDETPRG